MEGLAFPNSVAIRSAREFGFVSLDTQDIGLRLTRARFLIFLRENFVFTRMLHKTIFCGTDRDIFATRERMYKIFKILALVSCRATFSRHFETNLGTVAFKIVRKFGKYKIVIAKNSIVRKKQNKFSK